ncbi:MAG: Hpt domain-containing protein [Gemmatimonadales bacterium]
MDSSAQVEAVDEALLESYRVLQDEGQPDLVTELIDVFLEDLPGRLAAVQAAVDLGDPQAIRSAAHALKGSAASIGAARLAGACATLEALGRAGEVEGAPALVAPIERAAAEVAPLLIARRVPS